MKRVNRRDFIRGVGAGIMTVAAGKVLAACSAGEVSVTPSPVTGLSPVSPNTTLPATQSPTPTQLTHPYLVVARGGEPEEMVRQALKALGGIERFVKKGADVVIKPNIGPPTSGYEYAATTNPWVVAAVVKLCQEAGAKRVRVMDNVFDQIDPAANYAKSGIHEQVTKAGGEMEIMSRVKFSQVPLPGGIDFKSALVYEDILKADVLINIPIPKKHGTSTLTLGMKNLMGVVSGRRGDYHFNIGQRVADLTSRVMPTLTIVDAVRILVNQGPQNFNLNNVKKLDTIIASADIVAADSYAASLYNLKPDDIPYIKAGAAMGLGKSNLSGLKIEEIRVGG